MWNQLVSKNNSVQVMVVVFLIGSMLLISCKGLNNTEEVVTNPGNVTITFADLSFLQKQYEVLIDEFQEQYPHIAVQFVPIDGDDQNHLYLASLADTLILSGLPQDSSVHNYLDLQPFQDADMNFERDAFWPGSLDGCKVDGMFIGLPTTVQLLLLFYDETAFIGTSQPQPTPGWNWQDFENTVRLLADQEVIRYGFTDRGRPLSLLGPVIHSTLNGAESEYDLTVLAHALEWYISLARDGAIPTYSSDGDTSETDDLISNDQAVMWVDSLSSLPEWRQISGKDIQVVPFPVTAEGDMSQTTRAWAKCAVISSGTAHPQEAWAWLQFLSSHSAPVLEPLAIPAQIKVAENNGYWMDLDAQTATAVNYALNHAWYGREASQLLDVINDALVKAIVDNIPLHEALASIQLNIALPPPTPDSTPIAVSTPKPTKIPIAHSNNNDTVKYFVDPYYHGTLDVLETLADKFNQDHSDITIELINAQSAFGYDGYNFDQLVKQFDCFAGNSGVFTPMITQIYNLDPLIDADLDRELFLNDIPPDLLSMNRVNGELYALPVTSQPTVMYYNKDIFSEMGVEPPTLDWNLADFFTLASTISAEDIYGFVPIDGHEFLNFLLAEQEIQLYDLTSATPVLNFNDPKVLGIVTKLVDMSENGIIPPVNYQIDISKNNSSQRYSLVQDGNAAMWMNFAGLDYGFFAPPEGPNFEVGVIPLPSTGKLFPPSYQGVSLYISRQAEQPKACWQWFKYLSAQPNAFRGIPVHYSVIESAQFDTIIGSELATIYQTVMSQHRQELILDYDELYSSYPLYVWWPNTLASVFEGIPLAQALVEMQIKAQTYIDCMMVARDTQEDETWIMCAKQADPEFELPSNE